MIKTIKVTQENIGTLIVPLFSESDIVIKKIGKRKNAKYYNKIITADFETSHTTDNTNTWVYLWGITVDNTFYYGENIKLYFMFINQLTTYNNQATIVIYFHNLSYDWSYFKQFFGDCDSSSLFVDTHKPLNVTYYNRKLEFRCSYLLTMKSLAEFTKGLEYEKLQNAIDYSEVHQPNENFSTDHIQIKYLRNDVVGLAQALSNLLAEYKDNISTIPFTSTGYVRRECLNNFKKDQDAINNFHKYCSSLDELLEYHQIFLGGYTHGNYKYCNKTLTGNIRHRDFESFYPHMLLTKKFPSENFYSNDEIIDYENDDLNYMLSLYNENFCQLLELELTDCVCKFTQPYLSIANVCKYNNKVDCKIIAENGRILNIKGTFKYKCTFEDYLTITETYKIRKIKLLTHKIAKKEYIPNYLRKTILDNFAIKTNYKELLKTITDKIKYEEMYRTYMRSKMILNGIYGMCATFPIRDNIKYDVVTDSFSVADGTKGFNVDSYYDKDTTFLPYVFGLFTTSYARRTLFTVNQMIGSENIIYSDTDSSFYFSSKEVEEKISLFNEQLQEESKQAKSFITKNDGTKYFIGRFDDEKEEIVKFKFLHAKCYLYKTQENNYSLVCAGVRKYIRENNTITYNHTELGENDKKFDNFKEGFIFDKFGGTTVKHTRNGNIIVNIQKQINENLMTEIIDSKKTKHSLQSIQ